MSNADRRFTRLLVLAWALVAVALPGLGCRQRAQEDAAPTEPENVAVSTAAVSTPPSIGTFALYATKSVELNGSSLVTGCDVGVEYSTGPFLNGGVAAYLNSGAAIEACHTLYADSVYLNSGATLGRIDTNHLTDKGATHGAVSTLPSMPAAPAMPAATAGSTSITLNTTARDPAHGERRCRRGAVDVSAPAPGDRRGTWVAIGRARERARDGR